MYKMKVEQVIKKPNNIIVRLISPSKKQMWFWFSMFYRQAGNSFYFLLLFLLKNFKKNGDFFHEQKVRKNNILDHFKKNRLFTNRYTP